MQLVVHSYAEEPVELRQLVHFIDQSWSIEAARFEIGFQPRRHSAFYTLVLIDREARAFLHTVPSSPATEQYLFEHRNQLLATSDDEIRRAAFMMHLAGEEADHQVGKDYIDAVLVGFLRDRAEKLELEDLHDRLLNLPINKPLEGASSSKWNAFFEDRLNKVLGVLADFSEESPMWQEHILDLWADLRWYDPELATWLE